MLLITNLGVTSFARANDCCADLNTCIEKSDKAIGSLEKEVKELELGVSLCRSMNNDYNARLYKLEDDLNSPFRNPWIMGVFGAALGIILKGVL